MVVVVVGGGGGGGWGGGGGGRTPCPPSGSAHGLSLTLIIETMLIYLIA